MITFQFPVSKTEDRMEYPFRGLQDFLIDEFDSYVVENLMEETKPTDDETDGYILDLGHPYYRVDYHLNLYNRDNICSVVGIYDQNGSWYWVVDFKENDEVEEGYLKQVGEDLGRYIINHEQKGVWS